MSRLFMAEEAELRVIVHQNGKVEPVAFDEILHRVQKMSEGLNVQPALVTQRVIASMKDHQTTGELDRFAAETASYMVTSHSDYDILAVRLLVTRLQKESAPDFLAITEHMDNEGMMGKDYIERVKAIPPSFFSDTIKSSRDMDFSYFGLKTLLSLYLLADEHHHQMERPQHMYMRIACFLYAPDLCAVKKAYEGMSKHLYTHASPTIFHGGTKLGSCLSCYLLGVNDDLNSMLDLIKKCGLISKGAGGIGISISLIRSRGTLIRSTRGLSHGVVPFMKLLERTSVYVDQGGRRPGAFAVYLEPWHPDIMEFLKTRLPDTDDELATRSMYTALWIPDLFMQAVESDSDWHLLDPDACPGLVESWGLGFETLYHRYVSEGRAKSMIKARAIWNAALRSMMETGTPYMLYKDNVNRKCNQINLGTIRSSNLCVSGDTLILTNKGHVKIEKLWAAKEKVAVWNGERWSSVLPARTNINSPFLEVTLSDGTVIKCTPYHEWLIVPGKDEPPSSFSTKFSSENTSTVRVGLLPDGCLAKLKRPGQSTWDKVSISHGKNLYTGAKTVTLFAHDGMEWTIDESEEVLIDNNYAEKEYVFGFANDSVRVQAKDLKEGMIVARFKPPVSDMPSVAASLDPFMLGIYSYFPVTETIMDEESEERLLLPRITVPDKLRDLIDKTQCVDNYEVDGSSTYVLVAGYEPLVPMYGNKQFKIKWLEGFSLKSGIYTYNMTTKKPLRFTMQWADMPWDKTYVDCPLHFRIKLMLQTIGVESHILITSNYIKVFVEGEALQTLIDQGMVFHCNHEGTCDDWLPFSPPALTIKKVRNIEPQASYCFTEPFANAGVFNGVLLGNCAEITEYSDNDSTSCCNLASISLSAFWDPDLQEMNYKALMETAGDVTRNLNRVIDINKYSTEDSMRSNFRDRPIAIGAQGLADVFMMAMVPYDSQKAKELNAKIFEAIYLGAVEASIDLAKRDGPYESFPGSPFSKGKFQFDLWEEERSMLAKEDPSRFSTRSPIKLHWPERWEELRKEMIQYGIRNSLLTSVMPTASTAQILGNTECTEPIASNVFTRKVKSGEHILVNRYLVSALEKKNMWNPQVRKLIIENSGSVQGLRITTKNGEEVWRMPEDLERVFLTRFEIKQKAIIDLAVERGPFVDQSQSMNLFFESPDSTKITSALFYGWKKGIKTGSYYIRTQSSTQGKAPPTQATQQETQPPKKIKCTEDVCTACSS